MWWNELRTIPGRDEQVRILGLLWNLKVGHLWPECKCEERSCYRGSRGRRDPDGLGSLKSPEVCTKQETPLSWYSVQTDQNDDGTNLSWHSLNIDLTRHITNNAKEGKGKKIHKELSYNSFTDSWLKHCPQYDPVYLPLGIIIIISSYKWQKSRHR